MATPLAVVEALERALPDVAGDGGDACARSSPRTPRTSTPRAAVWRGGRAPAPRSAGWRSLTPGRRAMLVGDLGVVGRAACRCGATKMWPLMPRILSSSSRAEAVHHRHDDDQRRDAQHDAEEGEAGDHRDEALARGARADSARRPSTRRARRAACPAAPALGFAVPALMRASGRQARDGVLERQRAARSPVRAALQLDLAVGDALAARRSPARAGRSGRWWRTCRRPLVAVVVEHVDAGAPSSAA